MPSWLDNKEGSWLNSTTISLTLIACCMKSIAISMPNSSPAKRVNLLIMEQAPNIANKKSKIAVQTHTLENQNDISLLIRLTGYSCSDKKRWMCTYQPVQARKRPGPSSGRCLAKLNMNVYIITVGSATPKINKGWPPMMECIIPQIAVDANVWTAVSVPSANVDFWISIFKLMNETEKNFKLHV